MRLFPITLLVAAVAFAGLAVACGGGGDSDSERTPGSEAERPGWFPSLFPLPADTQVIEEEGEGEGQGHVRFRAPLPLESVVRALDLNLEDHGYEIEQRTVGDEAATFVVTGEGHRATVTLEPEDEQTMIDVVLEAE